MLPVLVLQTGNAPSAIRAHHGSFGDMVVRAAQLTEHTSRIVRVYAGETPDDPRAYAGAIITGSPANVTDEDAWIEKAADWVRKAMDADLPLFGFCFGHQLMAKALGGRVGFHPAGREIGTRRIHQTAAGRGDPVFQGIPAQFAAHLLHEQTVLEPPPGAQVLACNDHDPHQALRLGERAVSVQFHPEFTAPIMHAYLSAMHKVLRKEGADIDALAADVTDTPAAVGVMRNFLRQYVLPASVAAGVR